MSQKEKYDVFAIPRNFGEDGMTFNGISRRNLLEGGILAGISIFLIVKLPVTVSVKAIIICFVSIPLFFTGLIGKNGESLSQFILTFFKWLYRRRILHYYIDTGEDEPEPKKGKEKVKTLFKKRNDKEEIRYGKKKETTKGKQRVFDMLFSAKKISDEETTSSKSRKIYNMTQESIPHIDIREGMIVTPDKRYLKIVEIHPINFLLRSANEQSDIIMSFAELLRISPVKLHFKTNSNKADITKFMELTKTEISLEDNEACKKMGTDYIEHINSIATNNAISRRFFVSFEFENAIATYKPSEQEIKFALDSTVRNFKSYLSQCGNSIVEFETVEEENRYLLELFHNLLSYYNVEGYTLEDKINKAFRMRMKGGNTEEMCTNDFIAPDKIDLTHARFVVIDGVYHSYLYIPSGNYKTLVQASWLTPLINAGEAIDIDLYLNKQPSDKMQNQVGRNLRINKSKMHEVSSTSADYNRMGDIMESGYYLQKGINDGQEFYYMSVLITVKAFSKRDLENRVTEVIKMMTAKQIVPKVASYMQEQAFLSTLPFTDLDASLYKLSRRNILTSTAASTYMFTSFEICDDTGILLGTNEHNNSLVVVDLFNSKKNKNANMTMLGTSGAGKTFTLQMIATRFRRKHIPTYIIAPLKGHEFARCATSIGGEFIRISPGSPNCINVMEIRPVDNKANELLDGAMEEQSMLSMKIDSLLIFFSILMPEITNVEEQLLDEALVKTYAEKGITNDNESLLDSYRPGYFKTMPILGDLYKNLKRTPKAERVAIILNRFVNGSAKSFNQQTNVDLTNPYTVIDISYLKGKLLPAGMFIALDYVWDKAKENRMEHKAIIIDEVWKLIGGSTGADGEPNRLAADYVLEIIKIIRGYGGSSILAMQDISDLFALDNGKYGKAIVGNSKTKIVLNLESHEAELARDVLNLTNTEVYKIKNFDRGHGLLLSNGNNIAVEFKASDMEKGLITTDPEELRQYAELKNELE